jgi:hypothetical protein
MRGSLKAQAESPVGRATRDALRARRRSGGVAAFAALWRAFEDFCRDRGQLGFAQASGRASETLGRADAAHAGPGDADALAAAVSANERDCNREDEKANDN